MSVTPEADPSLSSWTQTPGPTRLFYSYSQKDGKLRAKLEEALALLHQQGLIAGWHDRCVGAGDEWSGAIDENRRKPVMILLLVSASFIASKYCWDIEVRRALERHDRGEARVIPIILRECDWKGASFGKLQGLPKDGKAVTSWANKDKAWTDVALGIRQAVEAMPAKPHLKPAEFAGASGKAGAPDLQHQHTRPAVPERAVLPETTPPSYRDDDHRRKETQKGIESEIMVLVDEDSKADYQGPGQDTIRRGRSTAGS